jgi:hypothetical protein
MWGNQHSSLRGDLILCLALARMALARGDVPEARRRIDFFWQIHKSAPAGTRRRWRCGQ